MNIEKNTLAKIDRAPQTLRDMVQDRMRTAIIEGHFAPGERLVERPLCEQLGVSRTVIRETIRFLEAEGLVDIIPNRGPIVAKMDWQLARQIYEIRRQLEGSAAATCALSHDAEFANNLTSALREIQARLGDTTWSNLLQATTQFYELIFAQADHTVAWEIVQRLNGRISRLRALTLAAKDRARPGISHMTEIHRAILSTNPVAARQAVHAHIDDAATTAQRFLAATPEGGARDA
ncbi:Pyruvate dehydrogenase complex repressor [Roseobacter fucihabitans]|uniref:Pyruvate dehydrogenase complex repressor n=1 Tax=Roseobacter fucihabitans TaxID=1537242 RepID=A0ABZ2BUC8_9RHOB|nr:GntR family transcriptional regulator [Roseobacter litoralis]MBC6966119.1 Pyruvate dehydrogenase complex repressor [Roseobacter litoralis]